MNKQRTVPDPNSEAPLVRISEISSAKGGGMVRAWDLPTRIFKWSLVALIVTAWASSGSNDPDMTVHKASGYGVLVLVVYRILWGLVGSSTARFSNFVRSPGIVWAYFQRLRQEKAAPYLGHNPVGGLMVVGLIITCGIQGLLGLFSSDGVAASGPFAELVGETISSWAASIHAAWFYFTIIPLVGLHIVANFYYQFVKRENLIGAMVTGRKKRKAYVDLREARGGSLVAAGACLLVSIGLVYGTVTLLGGSFFDSI
ncbi:cytochrome b/b6 domain-containing protein [Rhizobium leucaenae]|uniref:cytochrome b/b6 domain-containing protein n=1 Tax=Rhizobium leucaenae TaxID=29450 RepID=UPI0009EEA5B9|nr:cytochrome b/b6 domain-containing protein [Rhizobium leucaenae]MBB6305192.1 cytochrome b [Rhizobium leucaenae]